MSIFNELLIPKIIVISNTYNKNFNNVLKEVNQCFDDFEEEFKNGSTRTREKAHKDKMAMKTLQSINEDEDEPKNYTQGTSLDGSSTSSNSRRLSKKRNKNEMEGILSPEQLKRQKRKASVKAQSNISKQVNVNLTQKLRREKSKSTENVDKTSARAKESNHKCEDKENKEPNEILPPVQIKQEKISLPQEPMDTESLPINIEVKQEPNKDDIAMPPPAVPVPKPRKGLQKKSFDKESDEESTTKTRSTRTKKVVEAMPPPPVPSARSTRSCSRATRQLENNEPQPTEAKPKRTRAKKKASETASNESEKDSTSSQESVSAVSSPAEKVRPKRTRRGQKAAENPEPPKKAEIPTIPTENPSKHEMNSAILKQEPKIPKHEMNSPILQKEQSKNEEITKTLYENVDKVDLAMDETRIINKVVEMDQTVVLPNGVYNHDMVTPKSVDQNIRDQTYSLDYSNKYIMDATVVLDKAPKETNVTDDNSLITDDSDSQEMYTPPNKLTLVPQPSSAVKEKVQQFEEMASRVTRTKTRAMAKKEEEVTDTNTQMTPDKPSKPVLSADTLNKMNNLIFNGKTPQKSSSAVKPRAKPAYTTKIQVPSSTSKLMGRITDGDKKQEIEDPRQKKEAILDAKRELQRRKREEKMAAAAAAREAAERERLAAADAAAKEKRDKLAQANAGKMARLKEVERKKQEYMRKVAETEERRRAEEAARLKRLEDEQKRIEAQRKKQLDEMMQMKKEEAIMAKEIEKRQKEYIEKQKKQRMEEKMHTPLRTPGTPGFHTQLEPVYMADGFEYLNSDEEEELIPRPVPDWSTSKARKEQLDIQSEVAQMHIDLLFSVKVHSPDLREIFPNIERSRLKRTSSAVWRTPPHLPSVTE